MVTSNNNWKPENQKPVVVVPCQVFDELIEGFFSLFYLDITWRTTENLSYM